MSEFDRMKPLLTPHEGPSDSVYTPPDHAPVDKEGIYTPDDPSTQTDRLVNTERKFILPIAQVVSRVFRVLPITDDVYRTIPQDRRATTLNVIVSRSDIQQMGSNVIAWPAVRVVVKQYEVVRIHVNRDFGRDTCDVFEMELWVNLHGNYDRVRPPDGVPIGPEALFKILTRYADKEGILPAAMIPLVR